MPPIYQPTGAELANRQVAYDKQMENEANRKAAIVRNGGRSAPQSQASRALGLTPQDAWRALFPRPAGARLGATAPDPMDDGAAQASSTFDTQATPARQISAHFDPNVNSVPNTPPMNNPGYPRVDPHLDINGPAVQGALDQAAGITHTPAAPGVNVPSIYGSGHLVAPGETDKENAVFNAANGVPSLDWTPQQRQQNEDVLEKSHPAIFQNGTPENAAFVAHAQQYGEQSAHENVDKIMSGIQKPKSATASPTVQPKPNPAGDREDTTPNISAYAS